MQLQLAFLILATLSQAAVKPSKPRYVPTVECFQENERNMRLHPLVEDDCDVILDPLRNFEKNKQFFDFSRDSAKGFQLRHNLHYRRCGIDMDFLGEKPYDYFTFIEMSQAFELIMDKCVRGHAVSFGGYVLMGYNYRVYAALGGRQPPPNEKERNYYETSEIPVRLRASLRRKKPSKRELVESASKLS
jgi:hypothetical protein